MLDFNILTAERQEDGDFLITCSLKTANPFIEKDLKETAEFLDNIITKRDDMYFIEKEPLQFTTMCLIVFNIMILYSGYGVSIKFDDNIPEEVQSDMRHMAKFYYKLGDKEND